MSFVANILKFWRIGSIFAVKNEGSVIEIVALSTSPLDLRHFVAARIEEWTLKHDRCVSHCAHLLLCVNHRPTATATWNKGVSTYCTSFQRFHPFTHPSVSLLAAYQVWAAAVAARTDNRVWHTCPNWRKYSWWPSRQQLCIWFPCVELYVFISSPYQATGTTVNLIGLFLSAGPRTETYAEESSRAGIHLLRCGWSKGRGT